MTVTLAWKWDDVKVSALKDLWAGGISAKNIAFEIGCTRNAVIGKVHRLGLEHRKTVSPRSLANEQLEEKPRIRRMRLAPPTEREMEEHRLAEAHVESLEHAVDMDGLGQHHCRFVVRTYDQGGTLYCGEPRTIRSYCEHHAKRCFSEFFLFNN